MPAPVTKKRSQKSAPAASTAAVSRGSRNIWRAWYCEERVRWHYQNQGFVFLKSRWKSPFAEIDLVFRSPQNDLILVEVKSVTSLDFLHLRLSRKQKARLSRAVLFCLERGRPARLELAVVSQHGKVQVFSDIFD